MKVERICARCQKPFQARQADVNRGWARFCSKSCKASEQEGRTGQHHDFQNRRHEANDQAIGLAAIEDGWDGHKNAVF